MISHSFIVIIVGLVVNEVVSQSQTTCRGAQVCFADVIEEDCALGTVMAPNSGIFGCCPGCVPTSGVIPSPDTSACKPPASCLSDGKYSPVQCKGNIFTGRCFCSDEHGKRIFGQMWRGEASDMTCACSRRRAEIEASGRKSTLHCTHSGDYELLQCDEGLCWCAEPKTGQPTLIPVAENDMTRLPCYSAAVVGEQYLRRCESIVDAVAGIHKEQSDHGTNFLGSSASLCDYDGSYGAYQITNGIAYCTGRDGEILGSWQIPSSEMAGINVNCHCARDTMIYFPAKGMTVTETCSATGNYRPNQNVGDVYYCVDSDGYPVTDMLEAWPSDACASFA